MASVNAWAARLNKVTPPSETQALSAAIHSAIAENSIADKAVDIPIPEIVMPSDSRIKDRKLSQLVDENFPFDESQLAAITGMITQNYACLTGAAGTGKTTTTKKLVDELLNQLPIANINMKEYWRNADSGDPDDDYVVPDTIIPAIAMVGFTGRSSQMIKRNFPRDWHGNIMTIHRLLGFAPEYYDSFDEESQEMRSKMRFTPTYDISNKMPWDIVIIDEAGMVGLELWHQLLAAMKPGCRIYMIGDINQLPPVHGRSVFGFAMAKWPSFELTHIHRQQGANNAIVDNAWRILKGQMPVSEGRFQMLELKGDAQAASRQLRAMIPKLVERGLFDPIRDTMITPINGNEGARGFALGQLPLNAEFSLIFNPTSVNPRYIIDGGRERKQFAVGDKVMATKNDHESGITNGMTGIITEIVPHPGYAGDHQRFGLVEDVNAYFAATDDDHDEEFTLEELGESWEAQDAAAEKGKEKRDRGPSSHIVTVRFGDEEHGFELPFATLSEVGSLMTAYVVTCHKMQGGESPTIVIICHDAHKQMLYREWLYTAVTRASQKCILLYTGMALRSALNKQNIKGTTLAQKIESFNSLQRDNGLGKAIHVELPEARALGESTNATDMVLYEEKVPAEAEFVDSKSQEIAEVEPEIIYAKEQTPEPMESVQTVHVVHHHVVEVRVKPKFNFKATTTQPPAINRTADIPTSEPSRYLLDTRSSKGPTVESAPKRLALAAPDPYQPPSRIHADGMCFPDPYQWIEPESTYVKPIITNELPKKVNPWAAKLRKI